MKKFLVLSLIACFALPNSAYAFRSPQRVEGPQSGLEEIVTALTTSSGLEEQKQHPLGDRDVNLLVLMDHPASGAVFRDIFMQWTGSHSGFGPHTITYNALKTDSKEIGSYSWDGVVVFITDPNSKGLQVAQGLLGNPPIIVFTDPGDPCLTEVGKQEASGQVFGHATTFDEAPVLLNRLKDRIVASWERKTLSGLEEGLRTLLIGHPDPEVLKSLSEIARGRGIQTILAGTKAEFDQALLESKPDGIVIDMSLDGERGWGEYGLHEGWIVPVVFLGRYELQNTKPGEMGEFQNRRVMNRDTTKPSQNRPPRDLYWKYVMMMFGNTPDPEVLEAQRSIPITPGTYYQPWVGYARYPLSEDGFKAVLAKLDEQARLAQSATSGLEEVELTAAARNAVIEQIEATGGSWTHPEQSARRAFLLEGNNVAWAPFMAQARASVGVIVDTADQAERMRDLLEGLDVPKANFAIASLDSEDRSSAELTIRQHFQQVGLPSVELVELPKNQTAQEIEMTLRGYGFYFKLAPTRYLLTVDNYLNSLA